MPLQTSETRTTTVRIPQPVYDQIKSVVAKVGGRKRMSLNDFILTAITKYLRMHERRQIDAAFAGMSEDAFYRKSASMLAEEFERSDWEALNLGEEDLEREPPHAASPSR